MMNRVWLCLALAVPLVGQSAVTNWSDAVTYRDIIEARREGRPAPQPRPAPATRIVGRRDGKVLVETRYPLGGVTTNARTPHVIYRAAEVATNAYARRAYDAAIARLARAVAVQSDAADDSSSASPEALKRQAARLEREAEKIERSGGNKSAYVAGVLAAAAGAAGLAWHRLSNTHNNEVQA